MGGVTGTRCSTGISHLPDLFRIAICTVSWNPFILVNWDLAISFAACMCVSLNQLPLIMLNLSWNVRCNVGCQYLTAVRRSPFSFNFLTTGVTRFFSLILSLFTQLWTPSFTPTFTPSFTFKHAPAILLATMSFPLLVCDLNRTPNCYGKTWRLLCPFFRNLHLRENLARDCFTSTASTVTNSLQNRLCYCDKYTVATFNNNIL